jgi:hypothetical protein
MLCTVRLRQETQYFDRPTISWRSILARCLKSLTAFARHAARLLPLEIVPMDDETFILTEVISVDTESDIISDNDNALPACDWESEDDIEFYEEGVESEDKGKEHQQR